MDRHERAARRLEQKVRDAILHNRCVDGSRCVLPDEASGAFESGPSYNRPFVPPIATTFADLGRLGPVNGEEQGATLSVRRFEQLSLAARATLVDARKSPTSRRGNRFPTIPAQAVMAAIADIAEKIDHDEAGGHRSAHAFAKAVGRKTAAEPLDAETARLLSRRGLQIVGCRIEGDLMLVNARLPFSVRLIGCVIDGAVVVDHCTLTTLDLSGSVVRGIHATFLNANGSVRLRRTVSSGPVDFGGSRVRGLFDASDSITFPFDPPPNSEVFVGDRGAFNLSLSAIENELHCDRARIYGGLNLKGARVQRSIFMDRAIVQSPAAFVEQMLADVERGRARPSECVAFDDDDHRLAVTMRTKDAVASDIALETMRDFPRLASIQPVLWRLMRESPRAATCAVRADGLEISGTIFARRLSAGGRLRLKYAHLGGGLHLNGAHLRSASAIDAKIDLLQSKVGEDPVGSRLLDMRRRFSEERFRGDDALDLREAVLAGQLALQPYDRRPILPADVQVGDLLIPTNVMGVVTINGASIGGDARFDSAVFDPLGRSLSTATLDLGDARIGGDLIFCRSRGLQGIDAARSTIGGRVLFAERVERTSAGDWSDPVGRPADLTGKVDFSSAEIAGDATFVFDPDAVEPAKGDLDLQHVTVSGRLTILPPEPRPYELARADFDREEEEARRQRVNSTKAANANALYRITHEPSSIDLRNAKARIISHPPSAWPRQHGLLIGGFQYEGYRGVGPLVSEEDFVRGHGVRERIFPIWGVVGLTGIALGLAALLFSPAAAWIGFYNLVVAFCVFTVLSAINLSIRFNGRLQPLAKQWLARQRAEFVRPDAPVMWPLEPYIRAARVLRIAGEHLAANEVEVARLRLRRRMLDSHAHFMGKTFVWLVDVLARFGYGLGRTAAWVACWLVFAAFVFQSANHLGLMQPSREAGGRPQFVSLVYATDLVVPVMALAHETEWRPALPCGEEAAAAPPKTPASAAPRALVGGEFVCRALPPARMAALAPLVRIYVVAEWLFRGLGVLLCSIIAAALTARAQVLFAKIDD